MGGTFDPVHNGHLVAASEVASRFSLDEVVFVPTGQPWQKSDEAVSPAEDRYLMTVIATASNPSFSVSRVDIDRPGVTYTIDVRSQGRLRATYDRLATAPGSARYGPRVLDGAGSASPAVISVRDLRADVLAPTRLAATGWLRLAGGSDGLAALSAEDFIGEPSDPSDDDDTRARKARGLAALGVVVTQAGVTPLGRVERCHLPRQVRVSLPGG